MTDIPIFFYCMECKPKTNYKLYRNSIIEEERMLNGWEWQNIDAR